MGIWYASRWDVSTALDIKATARNQLQVDRAIEAASRAVEGMMHRVFYPAIATRTFPWPDQQMGRSFRLWLDSNEVLSISSLSSGGIVIPASDYFLEPNEFGPPFNRVEINLAGPASFGGGNTHQRNISITGLFGYSDESTPAGLTAEPLDASETLVDTTNGAFINPGDVIKVDSERMIVAEKSTLSSGTTTTLGLLERNSNTTVPVTSGASFNVHEVILVESERMLIVDITGNNLTVIRAWDGSTLAAHTSGLTVFVLRLLTVTRAALGTTAATHLDAAPITKMQVPSLIKELTIAEALNFLQQETSAYARSVGSGDNEREMSGAGLKSIRDLAKAQYARKMRVRVI